MQPPDPVPLIGGGGGGYRPSELSQCRAYRNHFHPGPGAGLAASCKDVRPNTFFFYKVQVISLALPCSLTRDNIKP